MFFNLRKGNEYLVSESASSCGDATEKEQQMKISLRNFLLLVLFCSSKLLMAQDLDAIPKDSTKNFKLTAFPVAFYLPETGFGFGGLGIATFRFKDELPESRPSTLQLGLTYTTKGQFLLFAPFELYADEERWRFVGELGFYKYFYNFYGLGDSSKQEDLETYDATFPRFRLSVLREIMPDFSIGLGYEYDGFNTIKIDEVGILANSNVIGKAGGTISNLGVVAIYDTRNNIFTPSKGFFIQGSVFASSKAIGSSFSYHKFEIDARYYQQLKGEHILATNIFAGNSSSGTPFLSLNYLGTNRTRGHDNRRFQDNAELSLALEYRFPIAGRFGGVLFGSTGTVSPSLDAAFSSAYKNAFGTGLRYIISKKEGPRIRADYGISREGGNFYLTIKEAF